VRRVEGHLRGILEVIETGFLIPFLKFISEAISAPPAMAISVPLLLGPHFLRPVVEKFLHPPPQGPPPEDSTRYLLRSSITELLIFNVAPSHYAELIKLPTRLRTWLLEEIDGIPIKFSQLEALHELVMNYPADNGDRIFSKKVAKLWQEKLTALLIPQPTRHTGCLKIFLPENSEVPMYLANDELLLYFTDSGRLRKEKSNEGRRAVHGVIFGDYKFHFKMFPEWPIMEYAVCQLHNRIVGYLHTPQSILVMVEPQKVKGGRMEPNGKQYPMLILETVEGVPLKSVSSSSLSPPLPLPSPSLHFLLSFPLHHSPFSFFYSLPLPSLPSLSFPDPPTRSSTPMAVSPKST
jgi:hypothetical protein